VIDTPARRPLHYLASGRLADALAAVACLTIWRESGLLTVADDRLTWECPCGDSVLLPSSAQAPDGWSVALNVAFRKPSRWEAPLQAPESIGYRFTIGAVTPIAHCVRLVHCCKRPVKTVQITTIAA
jgi:hypothetical protein